MDGELRAVSPNELHIYSTQTGAFIFNEPLKEEKWCTDISLLQVEMQACLPESKCRSVKLLPCMFLTVQGFLGLPLLPDNKIPALSVPKKKYIHMYCINKIIFLITFGGGGSGEKKKGKTGLVHGEGISFVIICCSYFTL